MKRQVLRIKGCPKCQGDVLTDCDTYGWYEQCLQCGYSRDLRDADKKELNLETWVPVDVRKKKH